MSSKSTTRVVLNKVDLLGEDERARRIKALKEALASDGRPFFVMSAATREGTQELINAIATHLDSARRKAREQEETLHEDVRFSRNEETNGEEHV